MTILLPIVASVFVSAQNPRYFEEDGKAWIPVGCNICFDRLYGESGESRKVCEERYFGRMKKFAANGGNFIRIWLGHPFFEVMPERPGEYDAEASETVRKVVKLAEELGVRIKFTLESFRATVPNEHGDKWIFLRPLYAPYAKTMREFFDSAECRRIYLDKARYLKSLGIADSPAVICWELWNEINAVGPVSVYEEWSDWMAERLREMFPRQMVVQNLGSFADPHDFYEYDYLARMKGNAFLQAHRYIDLDASLDVARGPMDVLCADSVHELLDRRGDKPALLAEVGAVLPRHAGPSPLYAKDVSGMLLHDEIFAPFFAGSAGCGQPWHWDHQYIDRHDLWYHFGRFARAVAGIDPVCEKMRPFHTETMRLRVYGLVGAKTTIIWCRDKECTWRTELEQGIPPGEIRDVVLPFESTSGFKVYLPWEDREVVLPPGKMQASAVYPFMRNQVH